MKIGFCGGLEQAQLARDAGYDYLEPGIAGICAMNSEAFAQSLEKWRQVGLPTYTANLFLPGDWPLGHAPLDEERNRAYLNTAADRLSALGVTVAVLGSGGARELNDTFGRERGARQFCQFYQQAAAILGDRGIAVAIEPICRKECGFLNTVSEVLDLLENIPEGPRALLCDFYHAGQENEPLAVLKKAAPLLRHCHIAHPQTRRAPLPNDGADYAAMFRALREIGYDQTISFEGHWDNDPAILRASAAYMKSLLV